MQGKKCPGRQNAEVANWRGKLRICFFWIQGERGRHTGKRKVARANRKQMEGESLNRQREKMGSRGSGAIFWLPKRNNGWQFVRARGTACTTMVLRKRNAVHTLGGKKKVDRG